MIVLVLECSAPTNEGGLFRRAIIVDDSMTVSEAIKLAESKTGAAILHSIEITAPIDSRE